MFSINNVLEHVPSKVTTHYHLSLRCYLSVVDRLVYVWCSVNEEWIESKIDVNDNLVFSLSEINDYGFARYACSRCECGGTLVHSISKIDESSGSNDIFSFDCESCGSSNGTDNITDALACCP